MKMDGIFALRRQQTSARQVHSLTVNASIDGSMGPRPVVWRCGWWEEGVGGNSHLEVDRVDLRQRRQRNGEMKKRNSQRKGPSCCRFRWIWTHAVKLTASFIGLLSSSKTSLFKYAIELRSQSAVSYDVQEVCNNNISCFVAGAFTWTVDRAPTSPRT